MKTVVVTEQDRESLIIAIKQTPLDGQHPYVCEWRAAEDESDENLTEEEA